MAGIEYKRNDTHCALCRIRSADEVGSHLAPNFMIQGAFSFDGKELRDREIVAREHVNDSSRRIYYGRSVRPEAIVADHGGELSDEEVAENVNILVYDHLFCRECEKRFGILEQEYRQFYTNPVKSISPRIACLFWLSVFWRMSMGYMAILLGIEDELAIRKILDKSVTTKKEIETSDENIGDFGYVIWRTKGIKKGYSGILGTRTLSSPYLVIINDMAVMLLSSVSNTVFPFRYGGLEITEEMVNTPKKPVRIMDITLEGFAKIKRFVLDQPIINGWGPLYEKGLRRFREEDRTSGNPHSNRLETETLETLVELDAMNPRKPLEFRYLAAMNFGEIKSHAAARLGMEYDILKDETMFMFQFDIENYISDCRKLREMGMKAEMLPFVDKYLKDDKNPLDERQLKQHWECVEKQLEHFLSMGYTLNDILDDNMRSMSLGQL